MEKNTWYTVRGQSLAVYARNAGFDLAVYDKYSEEVQAELRDRSVKEALRAIDSACREQELDVYHVRRGVYVIALSNPLSMKYEHGRSQVIYIGMGNIMGRLKSHFNYKLFDFMLSLAGADFDFSVACPARPGAAQFYK